RRSARGPSGTGDPRHAGRAFRRAVDSTGAACPASPLLRSLDDNAGDLGDGVDDRLVTRAATEVRGQGVADLVARGRLLREEGGRGHQEARGAEAALKSVMAMEGLLERVQLGS